MSASDGKAIEQWTVQSALGTVPIPPNSSEASPIAFLHIIERLKTTPREGWRRHGIIHGESIADHMYRMAITTMCCPDPTVKKDRCVKMAIVHDLAEAIVGDITPLDGISKEEKHRRESSSMQYMTKELLAPISQCIANEFMDLFNEYEEGQSPEAIFVKDIDCFELVMQTIEYEMKYEKNLQEFLHVAKRVRTPYVKKWVEDALKGRKLFPENKEDM